MSSLLRFFPGGARGLLYSLLSLAFVAVLAALLLTHVERYGYVNQLPTIKYSIALASYSIIYLGAGTLFARLLRRVMSTVVTFHILLFVGLINVLSIVAAQVTHFMFRQRMPIPQFFDGVDPFQTLKNLAEGDRAWSDVGTCVLIVAGGLLFFNLAALWRSVADIVKDPVRAQLENRPERAQIVVPATTPELASTVTAPELSST